MLQGLTPAVLWQGFFYNRYEPPAESKGGPGTETGANKDQQARTRPPLLQLPTCTATLKSSDTSYACMPQPSHELACERQSSF